MRAIIRFFKAIIYVFANKRGEVSSPNESRNRIPKHEIEAIARCLLPDVIAFFESAEGKKEFEDWKRERFLNKSNPQKEAI